MSTSKSKKPKAEIHMPSAEEVQAELGKVTSMDDFFGKDGAFAKLFARTMEEMLEAELDEHLGYEKYEAKGRNSGNSRNGKYKRKLRSSNGEVEIEVPRDREGDFEPKILEKHQVNTNELEDKIIAMYARGMTQRDIQDQLDEMYGMAVSPQTISKITDKIMPLVEEWHNRPLHRVYPIVYLDALYYKVRQDHKVANRAIYVVLAVTLEGKKDVLGHWVSQGTEGAHFWMHVLQEIQSRGVEDLFIASADGLKGFEDALHAVFPQATYQRCIVHQIRNSMRYVSHTDSKEFMTDLKSVYRASTREKAESNLQTVAEKWNTVYPIAIQSWQDNWDSLANMFDFSAEIRRLIYTNNAIEGYNRQLRKVTKSRSVFPSNDALRKLLWLAHRDIVKKWNMPIAHWAKILNQLAIHFQDRFSTDDLKSFTHYS